MKKLERQEAINEMKKFIEKTDSTVYTILRQTSRSGMKRSLDLYIIIDNKPICITYLTSKILQRRVDKYGLVVTGAGMDMGFAVVYALSRRLYDGDGYKLTQRWL